MNEELKKIIEQDLIKQETVENFIERPTLEEQEMLDKIGFIESKIYNLKQKLSNYDYIGTKIATGRATIKEYASQIEEMKVWTSEINILEEELIVLKNELEEIITKNKMHQQNLKNDETNITETVENPLNECFAKEEISNNLPSIEENDDECVLIIKDLTEQEAIENEEN